jgi:chromosome segregation ATPase
MYTRLNNFDSETAFTEGDLERRSGAELHTAEINVPGHRGAIHVYGMGASGAALRREYVLTALTTNARLRIERNEAYDKCGELEMRLAQSYAQVDNLCADYGKQSERLRELGMQLDDTKRRCQALEERNENQANTITQQDAVMDELRRECARLETLANGMDAAIYGDNGWSRRFEALQRDLDGTCRALETAQAANDVLRARNTGSGNVIEQLIQDRDQLQALCGAAQDRLQRIAAIAD